MKIQLDSFYINSLYNMQIYLKIVKINEICEKYLWQVELILNAHPG